MGLFVSKVANLFSNTQDARILLVGLDSAGKTTVLYKFALNETVNTTPTIGFNVETVQYKRIKFVMWDVGGQEKIRYLWKHYYQGTDGVVFMVDSVDRDRFDEARKELQNMLDDELLQDAAILVLANKQDLKGAASADEIVTALGLLDLPSRRKWQVHATNAVTGEGLYEGLDWLATELPGA
mmetsp:Transcript_45591/g.93271  ORF Transcript_45591/g.93271 Transcript_45591/m.93271 type:complete len:182 (+) Transcript_45591:167-712(+)|eukprot:CAMPEP_0181309248 /NCGR_PEP_ID=MMETSP1101-20121128/11913_1 /TAXON_ID=46948 /ORGANISM="Rhodomonas abbreviata, Strain Caron Lab Isolate" /LENGTH=181 /DNA_ID=CAMNT_0023415721 /DNA_START=172 /DNA_END=717 /DNA_ORIENTATION=+